MSASQPQGGGGERRPSQSFGWRKAAKFAPPTHTSIAMQARRMCIAERLSRETLAESKTPARKRSSAWRGAVGRSFESRKTVVGCLDGERGWLLIRLPPPTVRQRV